jgi:hypothetical protein
MSHGSLFSINLKSFKFVVVLWVTQCGTWDVEEKGKKVKENMCYELVWGKSEDQTGNKINRSSVLFTQQELNGISCHA